MRLERLEINGFKSFSDRSELAFDRGVTAIVGPNGCGKSNVADAITWVMGEQSAKSLRGDKMEDVIFSGSDARKPTAAAEVRLRLSGVLKTVTGPAFPPDGLDDGEPENGEGPEELIQSVSRDVEVTRRLYRSGESEYLIDGQACRLRDIHDLLMDTGLGAKAYAIIEQGKIGLILSSRPTDRRQLIEEAAGVTKYKTRRRAAELKLEAARQNLIRIDDIVFEVEKQTGSLKRQAARARRYQRLRDEMRRWEKVLFARRYRQLAEVIQLTKDRLVEAREREAAAAAHVAEVENGLGRLRIELVEAESDATTARESAHGRELAIARQQQHVAFEREQIQQLTTREAAVSAEISVLEARREPARAALDQRRVAAAEAALERDRAQATLSSESEAYDTAHREIEGFEADVEAARSEVFSAINAATALRHSIEHAASARDRVLERLSRLHIEGDDLRIESERVSAEQAAAAEGRRRAQDALEATRIAKAARESELASARIEHEWRARTVRSREQELAGLEARLASIEELQAVRAEYGDAPRAVLAHANGKVGQRGAVADYLEVDPGYERAVEGCLGELLQHVIVERPEQAAAGFQLVREQGAGRCGFLIASGAADSAGSLQRQPEESDSVRSVRLEPDETDAVRSVRLEPDGDLVTSPATAPAGIDGLVALSSVVHANGAFQSAIASVLGDAWIADSYERAQEASARSPLRIATLAGDVFRGPHLVSGGVPQLQRGILETKREVKDLAQRIAAERAALEVLRDETAAFEGVIAQASAALAALGAEHHRQEKAMVALEAQLQRSSEGATRAAQKGEQLARERRQAEEERDALERRHEEAHASIARLGQEQRLADEALAVTQRRLFEAREATEDLSRRAADAGAAHAALVERASGLAADVLRLEDAAVELEVRARGLESELTGTRGRVESLRAEVAAEEAALDENIRALEGLRATVASADEAVSFLRARSDEGDVTLRTARGTLEALRASGAEIAIAKATAESDLSHLASDCVNTVQATLDEVLADVAALEAEGHATPDAAVICGEEPDETSDDVSEDSEASPRSSEVAVAAAERQTLSAEEAISTLRARIERLGPVNMMAIQQFEELESRRGFLTTQRKDLVDSIAQTTEAVKRIDETTRQRFTDAFSAINRNFQEMFSTLFGGGRAGLALLDENDPLESGIEIVAQPPGKRLQSVQLLSGGEKALTAISLMFGLFKYKPSPFCLLDEIDAPLDDANIGRFVAMLQGMQEHTQFILITHNRKTMEIADRLYGVTMEEPGVSKLISVQLN